LHATNHENLHLLIHSHKLKTSGRTTKTEEGKIKHTTSSAYHGTRKRLTTVMRLVLWKEKEEPSGEECLHNTSPPFVSLSSFIEPSTN
jgi:hypothetical protein